ncbi:hypothetical protein [Engelhardtia mirabilis]|uniref:Uncharacterized protein n=1 Tax=Engelhardtia mirabilis TaxID=2528011 RepID=A0A518BT53_9BACT|nr:hypothetical protein Pla133_52720 [Planctomycetes bacterium Pla133]QDV04476.1 hypothetical protein Pla86_52720 [Planctomycetes bacterium Pla86]
MRLHTDTDKIARHLCEISQDGCPGSEQFPVAGIRSFLGIKDGDLEMALDELEERGLVTLPRELGGQPQVVQVEWELFFSMDESVMGWSLEGDALAVAEAMAGRSSGSANSADLATDLGWGHRRLNPPTHYLVARRALDARKPMTKRGFYYPNVSRTIGTDRFIRDNS